MWNPRYHDETPPVGEPSQVATSYRYDALDRRTDVLAGFYKGPDGPTGFAVTTTAYDAVGNVLSTTDPIGRVTSYAYDALDRKVQQFEGWSKMGYERASYWWYDSTDNVVRTETGGTTDPDLKAQRAAATYAYDAVNRQTSATEAAEVQGDGLTPLPLTSATVYNPADEPIILIDPNNLLTWQVFDRLGRMTSRIEGVESPVTRTTTFAHDLADNLLSEEHQRYHDGQTATDPLPYATVTTWYGYDDLDRRVEVVEAYGTDYDRATATKYDANDNVVRVTDPLGRVTEFDYDRLDRRVEVVEAAGDFWYQRTSEATDDAADTRARRPPSARRTRC